MNHSSLGDQLGAAYFGTTLGELRDAAKGIIKLTKPCTLSCINIPTNAPIIAVKADKKLKINAFFLDNPEYNNTPKSAISWGISWKIIEIVATTPRVTLAAYAPAITIPSIKL